MAGSMETSSGAEEPGLAWWRVAWQAAALWLVTRITYVLVTYFAVLLTKTGIHENFQPGAAGFVSFSPAVLMHSWLRWDTHYYLDIAQNGYHADKLAAFFPLYPILVGLLIHVLGSAHALLAGLVVGNLSALGAFLGLGLLAAGEARAEPVRSGVRAIRVLVAFPLAFFLTAAYSDALFLALAAFSLFFARRGVWRWAAVCAFLAGFTRLTSFALILPLVWEYGRQHDWYRGRWRELVRSVRPLAEVAMLAGAVPLSVGLYFTYLWTRFGHPLIVLAVERLYWWHVTMAPWSAMHLALLRFADTPGWSYWQARILIDLGPLLLLGLLTILTIRRMPVAFTLYMAGLLYLSMSSPIVIGPDVLISAGRYMLAAVPVFVLLGQWVKNRPWLDLLIVSCGFMLQALFAAAFLTGYWLV